MMPHTLVAKQKELVFVTKVWVVANIEAFTYESDATLPVAYLDEVEALAHVNANAVSGLGAYELDGPRGAGIGSQLWLVCDPGWEETSFRTLERTKRAAMNFAERPGAYGHQLEWFLRSNGSWGLEDSFESWGEPTALIAPVSVRSRFRA